MIIFHFLPKLRGKIRTKGSKQSFVNDFEYFVPKLRGRLEAQWQARISGTSLVRRDGKVKFMFHIMYQK